MKKVDYYNLEYHYYEGIYITRVADDGYITQSDFDGVQMVKVCDYEELLSKYEELKFRIEGLDK